MSSYQTILNLIVWHDYFRLQEEGDGSLWPKDYNILSALHFYPTEETEKLLKNFRMLFRAHSSGFSLLVESAKDSGDSYSIIPIPRDLKLTFLISVVNPNFFNYTNLGVFEYSKKLFYFNNRHANQADNKLFLSEQLEEFDDTKKYYPLGSLIKRGSKVYESNKVVASQNLDLGADWIDITKTDPFTKYVTPLDVWRWQNLNYHYSGPNPVPDKKIKFVLKNIDDEEVELGTRLVVEEGNPPVEQEYPWDEYSTPANPNEKVNYRIPLDRVPSGQYEMEIKLDDATPVDGYPIIDKFYLLNPLKYSGAFGAIELFFDDQVPNSVRLIERVGNRTKITSKAYYLRFKNRLTRWKYFLPDDEDDEFVVSDLRPLTQEYSKFSFPGIDGILPDPEVKMIKPQMQEFTIDGEQQELVSDFFSEIYLYGKQKT